MTKTDHSHKLKAIVILKRNPLEHQSQKAMTQNYDFLLLIRKKINKPNKPM